MYRKKRKIRYITHIMSRRLPILHNFAEKVGRQWNRFGIMVARKEVGSMDILTQLNRAIPAVDLSNQIVLFLASIVFLTFSSDIPSRFRNRIVKPPQSLLYSFPKNVIV